MDVNPKVKDARSEKILFITHCCLNQNAKVRGIAKYPGAITPLVEFLLKEGIGMYQMTCPENTYVGNMRWGSVKDQYNNPMFRRHCRKIAEEVVDQVENYIQCGNKVLGFIMMDGSPVCGLNRTPRPKGEELMWGGMAWYVPESENVHENGVYCGILKETLDSRGFSELPFVAAPEFEELGSVEDTLSQIRKLLA